MGLIDMFYCSVCLLDATAAMRLFGGGSDTTPNIREKTFPPQLNRLLCQHSKDVINPIRALSLTGVSKTALTVDTGLAA